MTDYPHDPLLEKAKAAGNSLERTMARKKEKRRDVLQRVERQRSQALRRITGFSPSTPVRKKTKGTNAENPLDSPK